MGDKKYKDRHRELGLCVSCSEKAVQGRSLCEKHLKTNLIATEKYKRNNRDKYLAQQKIYSDKRVKRRENNNLCIGCGRPLHYEADEGHKKCLNCRIEMHKPRWLSWN